MAARETRKAKSNRKCLEMCRALHIPEEQIAVLQRGSDMATVLKDAIFQYYGMRADGLPVCEGASVVQKPVQEKIPL